MKIVHYRRVAIDNIQREMWLEFVFAKKEEVKLKKWQQMNF